jgi:hypothetical protein
MTEEQIKKFAERAGLYSCDWCSSDIDGFVLSFARSIEKNERNRCLSICEGFEIGARCQMERTQDPEALGKLLVAMDISADIRKSVM